MVFHVLAMQAGGLEALSLVPRTDVVVLACESPGQVGR